MIILKRKGLNTKKNRDERSMFTSCFLEEELATAPALLLRLSGSGFLMQPLHRTASLPCIYNHVIVVVIIVHQHHHHHFYLSLSFSSPLFCPSSSPGSISCEVCPHCLSVVATLQTTPLISFLPRHIQKQWNNLSCSILQFCFLEYRRFLFRVFFFNVIERKKKQHLADLFACLFIHSLTPGIRVHFVILLDDDELLVCGCVVCRCVSVCVTCVTVCVMCMCVCVCSVLSNE